MMVKGTSEETTAQKLDRLGLEILYHRGKAASYRKRAAAQDAIADAKVKEAAALGTPELPAVENPVTDGEIYPQLAPVAPLPARERMRKAIADGDERAYEKAQADLEKEHHPIVGHETHEAD